MIFDKEDAHGAALVIKQIGYGRIVFILSGSSLTACDIVGSIPDRNLTAAMSRPQPSRAWLSHWLPLGQRVRHLSKILASRNLLATAGNTTRLPRPIPRRMIKGRKVGELGWRTPSLKTRADLATASTESS
jgi:hypothetical protein